ncbi:Polyserase-2 [Merluccius polli]|uniref:Polyserase-2 n=1 Tax=Merluccius polli TaxID=89951 RepID=A0AA47MPI9_MERPO|nr:Polyserase-2 [Merluccius polli]
MEDSGLLELIQLIYPGSTTAKHILDGGCFDKAIRAHLLIDTAIYQHIMKHAFTEEELGEIKTLMEKVADGKMGARYTDPVVVVFEQRFEEIFKRLAKGGRTPALWVQYHYMVDVIKIFIRTERLADHNGHLSCIVTRMLDIFAAAGHHQHAKGARLYCQLMKQLETLPAYKEIFKSFNAHGNHVVRYSSHDWSGTWCDICIEQTLMKAAKSEGGLSRGRMRNKAYSQLDAIKLKCSRECRLVCLRGTAAAEVHKSHCCSSFFEPFSVCGRPPLNTRIVGGEDAPLGSWPWQASLTSDGSHFCGGSLITNNFVLTAAHCFFPRGTAAAEVHKSHCCFSFFEPFSVCGRPPLNTRIVGGEDAPLGSWPWQASLTRNGGHFCGGSLINNNFVLTAAHCFFFSGTDVEGFAVVLGRQSQENSNPNEVSRNIAEIIIHPEYNPSSDDNENDNDICLLRLSSPVEFTSYIRPVCLAAQSSTIHAGTVSWVTGWGTINSGVPLPSPQNLQEVDVPVVGNRQCDCNYGEGTITDNMICAGLSTGGKDSCQGDSGGPLVSKQGNQWILIGVVSFGQGCAEAEFPGVYARVSPYNEWINSHVTDNQPGFVLFSSVGTDSDFSVTCDGLSPAPTAAPLTCGSAPLNSHGSGELVQSAGVWPWMASLQNNGSHICGGSLVAANAVLSDTACFTVPVTTSNWSVVLGRLKHSGTNVFEVTLGVKSIKFSNLTGDNVALLILSGPVMLSDYIQPLCQNGTVNFLNNSDCWLAGWGQGEGGEEETLQEFQTTVVDCGNASSSSDNFCTQAVTIRQGDTGGPLMCRSGSSWTQLAVLPIPVDTRIRTVKSSTLTTFVSSRRYLRLLEENLGTLPQNSATSFPMALSTLLLLPSFYLFFSLI